MTCVLPLPLRVSHDRISLVTKVTAWGNPLRTLVKLTAGRENKWHVTKDSRTPLRCAAKGAWAKTVFSLLLLVREASRQKPSSQFQPLQTSKNKRTSRNEPETSSWHTTVNVVTAAPSHMVCRPVSLHKLFATGPRPNTEMKSKHLEAAVWQGSFVSVKPMRTFCFFFS